MLKLTNLYQQPCKSTCRLLITESSLISRQHRISTVLPLHHSHSVCFLSCFLETSAHCVALAALELAEIDVPGLKVGFTLAHIYSCLAVPTTQNTDWTRTQGLRTVRDSSISMAPTSRPPHRPLRCQSGAFSVVLEGCRLQHFF